MLIEFSAANHRAIRERQTFLMAAGEDTERTRPNRTLGTGFAYAPRLFASACIVGPNGAGKSSLIDAMRFMNDFAQPRDRGEENGETGAAPFILHTGWSGRPSEFEVVFVLGDTLFQYGFTLTRSRVTEEWLFAAEKGEAELRTLFTRCWNERDSGYEWDIGGMPSGVPQDFWKSVAKPDALFLAAADRFNITDEMESVRLWVTRKLIVHQASDRSALWRAGTAERFGKDGWKDRVIVFLRHAGIRVDDIRVERIGGDSREGSSGWRVATAQRNNLGKPVWMDLRRESTGVRTLFDLAAPILDALAGGGTLVIDELNLGLHPLTFESLLRMFHDPSVNTHGAQMIFTTHDLAAIEHARLDRGQIWLVQETGESAARLYPLSDFRASGKRSFAQGYLQGLYGAIPRVSRIRI